MAEIILTREQQAVVENRGGTLLVSAAAGSGKTKVLIDRILRRVETEQMNVDDFLMITFSTAAASELRGKLIAQLSMELARRPDDRHLQKQMSRVYLAQISTVHSFCSSLLREYAYLLELPPDFRVCDEQEAILLRERAMQAVLEQAYSHLKETPDIADTLNMLAAGRNDRVLPELIWSVYLSVQCCRDPQQRCEELKKCLDVTACTDAGETIWGRYLIDEMHHFLDGCIKTMDDCLATAQQLEALAKYVSTLQDNVRLLRSLRAMERWEELQTAAPDFGRLSAITKCTDPEAQERVKVARTRVVKKVRELLSRFSVPSGEVLEDLKTSSGALRGLFHLTEEFSEAFQSEKRRRRMLDYNDLEHEALRLLVRRDGSKTNAAREISQRYAEVMVDEYQDTNAVQDAIFSAVSRDGQNLFFVGDVKQSIYRFRQADPTLFLQKYRDFADYLAAGEGEPRKILLSDNFRSYDEVLFAANDVFTMTMTERVGGLRYGEREALRPKRQMPAMDSPAVELHCIDTEEVPADKHLCREEIEAEFVAGRIASMLLNGETIPDGEGLRPVVPEDIVILMRSPGGKEDIYKAALQRRGIRCVSGSDNIFASDEITILTALLQVIDNPRQDIPLLTVLLSPLYRFSSDDLALARAGDRHGCIYDTICGYPKAAEFVRQLNSLRDFACTATLRGLLDAIDERLFLRPIFGAMEGGAQRLQNLEQFFSLADSYENGEHYGLPGFLRYLAALREKRVGTDAAPVTGAVRIMTVHKSKGLEFPVVFLADLCKRFNIRDTTAPVLVDMELGIGARVYDGQEFAYPTAAYHAIGDRLRRENISEEMRLLYVAMTRAQYRLVMTCCRGKLAGHLADLAAELTIPAEDSRIEAAESMGDWLLMTALARSEAGELFQAGAYPRVRSVSEHPWHITYCSGADYLPKREKTSASVQGSPDKLLPFIPPEDAHKAARTAPSKLLATQLKGRDLDGEASEETETKPLPLHFAKPQFTAGHRALTPTERGTAIHLAMQYLRYESCTDAPSVERELDRLVEERFLTLQQRQAVPAEKLLRFFRSNLGQRVLTSQNVKREFKFSVLEDGGILSPELKGEQILLQGVTDCCLVEADGLVVLDFKSDRIRPGEEEERAAYYRGQMDAYSRALSRIFARPVKERILWFFATDKEVYL